MAEFTGTFERKEVKYRLSTMQVRAIKQALSAHMAPDEYGQTSITSVYYDTPNRDMISRSLEKPLYKEKLRLRTYGPRNASAPVFVELKKKHEGIVYKRRIAASEPAAQLLMVGVPYERAISRHPLADEAFEADSRSAKNLQIAEEIAACVRRNGPVLPSMAILVERVAWGASAGCAWGRSGGRAHYVRRTHSVSRFVRTRRKACFGAFARCGRGNYGSKGPGRLSLVARARARRLWGLSDIVFQIR